MSSFNRIMDSKWKRKKWDDGSEERKLTKINSHWGQLKLFYAELEFLNICYEECDKLIDSVIIYIGSAPGTHINYLIQFYPNIYWILIDPNKFHIQENEFIKIYNSYFTDEMIPEILNHDFVQKSKYVLFISDIRTDPKEDIVFKEMLDQQRWLLKIGADMSMLKFRLPYTLDNGKSNWEYDLSDILQYIKKPCGRPVNTNKDYNLCYLKGDIYVQIYPPQFSTETRLIVNNIKKNKFKMCNYDTVKYEEQCFYYNLITRTAEMEYKLSSELKKHILGCRDTYETCSIYYIIENYLKNKEIDCTLYNICNMLYKINKLHSGIYVTIPRGFNSYDSNKYIKSLGMIIMYTSYEKINTEDKYKYEYNKNPNIYTVLTEIYKKSIKYNLYQINEFSSGDLLLPLFYSHQIKQLEMDNEVNKLLFKLITGIHNKVTSCL